jgi:hypothetical protein
MLNLDMAQQFKSVREYDFSKGYADKYKAELLPKGYCADALNCWLDRQFIKKRSGYTAVGNDVEVEKPILSLAPAKPGGTERLYRVHDIANGTKSVIEHWSGTGNWTTLTDGDDQTAGKDHWFVNANNILYIGNDTDTVLKSTNGTSTADVAGFPVGVDAKWFHNYMFVVTAAGRLYFSNLNTPETWGAEDYIDVNATDGDTVIGLAVLKDELLICKRNRVWSLTGFGASDFTVDDLGERLTGQGPQSRKSIIEGPNDVYFLSYVGNIPHITSVMRTREGYIVSGDTISDPIEGTMDGLSRTYLYKACGIFDGKKLWFAVVDDLTYNDLVLVYDLVTKGWTRHTGIKASCFAMSRVSGTEKIYFGEASNDSQVYVLDGSTSDNGEAIDMKFTSPMYAPVPESKCKWKYLYVVADVESGSTIGVEYSIDGYAFNSLGDIVTTGDGGIFPCTFPFRFGTPTIVRHRFDSAGGTSYRMQYRFVNDTDDESPTIREYQLLFKPRGLRAVAEGE